MNPRRKITIYKYIRQFKYKKQVRIEYADPVETAETAHDIRARAPAVQQQGGGESATRVELAKLNEEQRRAHDIIEEKLKEHLAGEIRKK